MKQFLCTLLAMMAMCFTVATYAKTNEEIAQMCETLSDTVNNLATQQTKEICISRLVYGANLIADAGHFILVDERMGARVNINSAIEEIGMSELSGCKELTKLHFAKADAYGIRNDIDAL